MTQGKAPEDTLVAVRATVNLSGLRAGEQALVDPEQAYIAECLAAGYLVRTGADERAPRDR